LFTLDCLRTVHGKGQLLDDVNQKTKILESQTGRTRSYFLESAIWQRLWSCLRTEYEM